MPCCTPREGPTTTRPARASTLLSSFEKSCSHSHHIFGLGAHLTGGTQARRHVYAPHVVARQCSMGRTLVTNRWSQSRDEIASASHLPSPVQTASELVDKGLLCPTYCPATQPLLTSPFFSCIRIHRVAIAQILRKMPTEAEASPPPPLPPPSPPPRAKSCGVLTVVACLLGSLVLLGLHHHHHHHTAEAKNEVRGHRSWGGGT